MYSLTVSKSFFFKIAILIYAIVITTIGSVWIFAYSGDYIAYRDSFAGFGGERFEPGFRILSGVFANIFGPDEQGLIFFLAFCSVTTLSIKFFIISKINRSAVFMFLVIYTAYFFLLHESNQIRASLGIAFGLLSVYHLCQNKKVSAAIFLLLAISFHYSMLLFVVPFGLDFFIKRDRLRLAVILAAISICFVWLTFNPLALGNINPLMVRYAEFNLEYRFHPVYLFLLVAIVPLGYINIKRMPYFGFLLYISFVIFLFLSLALMKTPIVAVRVMDIANIAAFFFIFSVRFSLNLKVCALYSIPFMIALPRCYVFLTTDTILKFPV